MEGLLVLLGIITVAVGLSLAISGAVDLCLNLIEKKRQKAHPQLWTWFDECDEALQKECYWYNAQIASLKNKVDAILREWDYYTAETKLQKEEELENLRKAIESADVAYREMCNKTKVIRSKIHDYVEAHNLEWARKWGW